MRASEARQAMPKFNEDKMRDIYAQIKTAALAGNGSVSVNVRGYLQSEKEEVVRRLKANDYTVSCDANTLNIRWAI